MTFSRWYPISNCCAPYMPIRLAGTDTDTDAWLRFCFWRSPYAAPVPIGAALSRFALTSAFFASQQTNRKQQQLNYLLSLLGETILRVALFHLIFADSYSAFTHFMQKKLKKLPPSENRAELGIKRPCRYTWWVHIVEKKISYQNFSHI